MVENEIEQVVSFHTASERLSEWNLNEIKEVIITIFPIEAQDLKKTLDGFTADGGKLDKIKAKTSIIEYLSKAAKEAYEKISKEVETAGLNWKEIEKSILIRSIDMLWMEHLDAVANMRQGIGLRGYGQRDPLIEYKREAYGLYNELNNLIQKEVVYSIYKVGYAQQMMAKNPQKEQDANQRINSNQRIANKEKAGRNDHCPCGSGKKFKKCCGK
jgi:preprotein translocase subunit SecA